jgi:hypothetical protein
MALHFSTSTNDHFTIVVTCDSAVNFTDESKAAYSTRFTLKPLGPQDRERAEIRAGAFTRSELGKLLWAESPNDKRAHARWHHALTEDEREALASYEAYISKSYVEYVYVRESLISINDEPATMDMIDSIRPEHMRITTITEIVLHLQRVSLLGDVGK